MLELKNDAMFRSKSGGSKQGLAALFSKQSSVAISTAVNSYDSISWRELRACCGKKHGNSITNDKKDNEGRWKPKSKKELISELKNAAMLRSKSGGSKQGLAALFSKQSSVAISTAVNSYDSMSRAELRACCGKKHGNSISASKKVNEGRWKSKSKKELMSELKNAAMLRRGSARLE